MNLMKAFTLIEVMIVMAIIGILLAVAVPAYHEYSATPEEKQQRAREWKSRQATKLELQTQCIAGYTFLNGKQILGSTGAGVACN